MAAELVGTTIGVIGLLGQLFDGCIKAYGYFTTASQLDTDSQRLMCKVRIEEMRLVVWGREWGVAEGRLEAHLDSGRNPQLRALAMQILKELHGTVADFRKLQDRYGLVEDHGAQDKDGEASNGSAKAGRGWRKEVGLRTKWVIADKDKFTNLLRDLKDFNDGLERLFPAWQLPSLQRAWTHQLLESAQRDLGELSLLETASTGIYPQLEASAKLKRLRINLDSTPQSAFKPTFALRVPRAALAVEDLDSPRRCRARHEAAGDVVVEWVDYDADAVDERVVHVRRMDDLARMMHSASERHPDLHSVDCVGYTDDAARSRYGLVYKAPAPSFATLHALIASTDLKTPDLNDRVRLARTLAIALWSLHSLDWLHKSLCASNVLFFPSAFSSAAAAAAAVVPDISAPSLSGFDASRPDLDAALSVAPRNPSIEDLHRHPAALRGRPHRKAFDVYSLGLVLLEIGLWKVLQTFHKPHYAPDRWRDKVLLAVLVPGLAAKVGRLYASVVDMCLRAGEDLESGEAGKLMETVVTTLESIRV
ncbi:prion-inhibition and propagation domain-containing protein [Hirsutella rhossiliensis]|uniref:Prion-inhibition and propagation domain-containing protein n=1 Tax=Hirsutella rhossiliensis TaxID=111463 RepID=A0A9P8SHE0_9HYPO|nr:prion-inhibition and propagation domain-containing protein [Hirsutella rhossiliensis]KAH0960921.1 prion-inhibition and propagation domain-containing protein [Hirsutella rhossiliensis]